MKSMTKFAVQSLLDGSSLKDDVVVMVTLTSAGMVEGWVMSSELNRFMSALKKHYANKHRLNYIVAREIQKRGVYHYHIIFFDFAYIPIALIQRFWRLGYVWISAMKESKGVAYAVKYCTKSYGEKEARLHASLEFLKEYRDDYMRLKDFFSFSFFFSFFLTVCSKITEKFKYHYEKLLSYFNGLWSRMQQGEFPRSKMMLFHMPAFLFRI